MRIRVATHGQAHARPAAQAGNRAYVDATASVVAIRWSEKVETDRSLWGMTDDDCKEGFGQGRALIVMELRIRGAKRKGRKT
jgi:hypothetical protein